MTIAAENEDKFISELFAEDPLGVVVRAAIRVEAQLNRYIEHKVAEPSALPNLEFGDRLALALALGLEPELKPALLALSSIRNKFAHRLDAALDEVAIRNYYNTLSPEQKASCQKILQRTKPDELNPMNRFRVMVATIYLALEGWVTRSIQAKKLTRSIFDTEAD